MRRKKLSSFLGVGAMLVMGGAIGFSSLYFRRYPAQDLAFTITAHKYAYEPSVIEVNRGDRVEIHLVSDDVTHGFYLEGYDLDAKVRRMDPTIWIRRPSEGEDFHEAKEISFVASRAGKFRFRCSQTCGYMHPFMNGVLIVRPNYLYSTALGLSFGLVVGMLWVFRRGASGGQP